MHKISFLKSSVLTGLLLLPAFIFSQSKPANVKRPNILFCIADDASRESMSAYGFNYAWVNTPAFDRVAKEGLLFNRAYTPNAKCAPSRASILTGRNSWQLEAAGNHNPIFPEKFTTFMEVLGRHGYTSAYRGNRWAPAN